MQFLNSKGILEEGEPLDNIQIAQRKAIIDYLHVRLCGYAHSDYSRRTDGTPDCEAIANFFITKFDLTAKPNLDLKRETEKYGAQSSIEQPPVLAASTDDDLPL